jgi:hypothetical protein
MNSTKEHKGLLALSLFLVFCGTIFLLRYSVLTASREVICGLEEHTHTAECYEVISNEDETSEEVLICEKEEHTHEDACYKKEEEQDPSQEQDTLENSNPQESQDATQKQEDTPAAAQAEEKETTTSLKKAKANSANQSDSSDEEKYYDLTSEDNMKNIVSAEVKQVQDEYIDLSEDLPIETQIYLNVGFKIPTADIIENDGLVYMELPSIFEAKEDNYPLTDASGTTTIGQIYVYEDHVKVQFDMAWVNKHQTSDEDEQYVNASVPVIVTGIWAEITQDPMPFKIGEFEFEIDYENDLPNKYAEMEIEKSQTGKLVLENGQAYLTYTLSVSLPSDLDVDEVSGIEVEDTFTSNAKYVDSYVGVDKEAKDVSKSDDLSETSTLSEFDSSAVSINNEGHLLWSIGTMKKGETRTLTYKVKLTEEYTNGVSERTLENSAVLYSKTDEGRYERDKSSVTYKPTVSLEVKKETTNYNIANDTIAYTLTVSADASNSYTLTNLMIKDTLDQNYTQYLDYDATSFLLNSKALSEANKLDINNDDKSFTMNIEELKPGQSVMITYVVDVDPAVIATSNETVLIKNTAQLFESSTSTKALQEKTCTATIAKKVWNRKMSAGQVSVDTPIEMSGNIYDSDYKSLGTSGSFTISAGAYEYTVVVNEAADWNVSGSKFEDAFTPEYLAYEGYLKVEVYDGIETPEDASDEEVSQLLTTPKKTVWLKIDKQTSFNFIPQKLGLDDKAQAYKLTYYAVPNGDLSSLSQTTVTNNFKLSGTAKKVYPEGSGSGTGQDVVEIPEVTASTSNVVQGDIDFTAEKLGWYFDIDNIWPKGELYWIIKVDGSLKRGAQVIDNIVTSGTSVREHYLWVDSCQGVFRGSLDGLIAADGSEMTDITQATDLNDLKSLGLQELQNGTDYSVSYQSRSQMTWTFQKDMDLGVDESVYIVIKTEPKSALSQTSLELFKNKVSVLSPGGLPVEQNTASLFASGHEVLYKRYMGSYEYDAETNTFPYVSTLTESNYDRGESKYLDLSKFQETGSGTYIEWMIYADWNADLEGMYQFVEQLPSGTELAYIRVFGVTEPYLNENGMVQSKTISEYENDPDWTKVSTTSTPYKMVGTTTYEQNTSTATIISYYNSKTNQVRFNLDNFYKLDPETVAAADGRDAVPSDIWSKGDVEIQVVVRVTDDEMLMAGAKNTKTYTNIATATDSYKRTATATNSVTISKSTLAKSVVQPGVGKQLDFTVEINPLAEKLNDASTITVKDDMDSNLKLSAQSIVVYEWKDNQWQQFSSDKYKVQISTLDSGTRITLTLPNSTYFKVEYSADLNGPPFTDTQYSNKVYYDSYATLGLTLTQTNRYLDLSGSAGIQATTTLSITKLDGNTNQVLEGVEFTLTPCTYENGKMVKDEDKAMLITSDAEASVLYSQSGLEYGVIYCLEESKPLTGYVTIDPMYILYAERVLVSDSDTESTTNQYTYKDYSDLNLPDNVKIVYSSSYSVDIYNYKPKIVFSVKFVDDENKEHDPIPGVYKFALYNTPSPNSNSKPVKTLEVNYRQGEENPFNSLSFENLSPGTYSVVELDDYGNPITSSTRQFFVSDNIFLVSGTSNTNIRVSTKNVTNVQIVNKIAQYQMVNTGSFGLEGMYAGGATCIALALIAAFISKKPGKQETD